MKQLHFLGTGAAMVKEHYHTSFIVEIDQLKMLVDTMGGYDIKQALQKNNKNIFEINALFISHCHLDHSLGFFWILRLLWHQVAHHKPMPPDYTLSVLCSPLLKKALISAAKSLCPDLYLTAKPYLQFIELQEGKKIGLKGVQLSPLNLQSKKEEQFSFVLTTKTFKLAFTGDEPLRKNHSKALLDSDILIHDCFSLEADEQMFGSREKSHSTALDAAHHANFIRAKAVVLTHIADEKQQRKERFTKEAKSVFKGKVYVPDDGEIIILEK